MKKKKKNKRFSEKCVTFIFSAMIGYFIVECIFQYLTGTELSPAMTAGWYTICGAELAALATIRNNETKHGGTQPPESEDADEDIYE